MRAVTCEWGRCDQPAETSVVIGPIPGGEGASRHSATTHGAYCLLHGVAVRRLVSARTSARVWFEPSPPPDPPLRLVGEGSGRPLHRHVLRHARRQTR